MNAALSEREQRLLAVGLLVAALAAAWFAVLAPLKAGFDGRRDRREAAAERLRHDWRLIAGGQAVLSRLTGTRAAAAPLTLPAKDLATASRLAQLRVARAAAARGVGVASLKVGPGSPPLVRVEADLKGGYAGLAAFLQDLQTLTPQARIDHVVETRSDSFQGQDAGPAVLDAHVSLTYAYRPD